MNATVPAGAESFSGVMWSAPARRVPSLRPGWFVTMVAKAQAQVHNGTAPIEPLAVYRRHQLRAAVPVPQPCVSNTTSQMPPTLQHIERADLMNIQRLLVLYHQAVQHHLIGSSEAERLTFVALAQHVLSCRPRNEGGLFRHLLKQKRYHCVTQTDEDVALQRLKRHLYERS